MLASIYGRVSTGRQEKEETIENQLMAIREFASKNGHTIVKEYLDEGWSGTLIARPSLDELRLDAKKKAWEACIIYDPDRLARRYSYQELVTDELDELGIQVLYVTTPPPKDDSDKLLYGVKGLFAEYERAKIAERFRLGKIRKAREGHVVTSEAPYGYDYIPKQAEVDGYYQVNKKEAAVVKMIFAWVATEGLTIRKVIKRLQDLGIPPRKSKRGTWNNSTLTAMLRREVYIGIAYYNRSVAIIPENPLKNEKYKRVKKTSRRLKQKEDWVAIPVPAILEEELFNKVAKQLQINYALSARNKKNEYLLAGKTRCICGRTRTGEGPQKGKHLYYRCTDRVNCYPLPPQCKRKGTNARIADKLVWKKVRQLMSSPKLMEAQARRWLEKKETRIVQDFGLLKSLKTDLEKIKKEESRYIKAFGAGIMDQGQFEDVMNELKVKKGIIERQLGTMSVEVKKDAIITPTADQIIEFSKVAKSLLENLDFQARQGIIRKVIDTIIADQTILQVRGYLLLNESNYVKFKSQCRNCWITKRGEIHVV